MPGIDGNAREIVKRLAGEKVSCFCLVALILATTVVWSFQFISFHDAKMIALWMGVLLLWVVRNYCGGLSMAGVRAWRPAGVGLLLLGGASVAWSRVPWLSVDAVLRAMPLFLAALLAYDMTRTQKGQRAVYGAIAGAAVGVALLALGQRVGILDGLFPVFEFYRQPMYSVFGNEGLLGGFLALGLLMLPALWPNAERRALRGCLLVAGLLLMIALLGAQSRAGQLAFLTGVVALCSFPKADAATARIRVAVVCVVGLAVLGGLAMLSPGPSGLSKWLGTLSPDDVGGHVRLWIGRASIEMLSDHPITGVGLGNFVYWAPRYMGDVSTVYHNTLTTYHGHFDLLEFYCETGVFGLFFVGWLAMGYRVRCVYAHGALLALGCFSLFYPVWASVPHALALVLLLGINLQASKRGDDVDAPLQMGRFCYAIPLVLGMGAALHSTFTLLPSYYLCRAENLHVRGEDADAAYRRAVQGLGFRGEAHEAYGLYLWGQGNYAAAWDQLRAAEREWDTGRLYLLLSQTAEALGYEEQAIAYQTKGRRRWPWAVEKFNP